YYPARLTPAPLDLLTRDATVVIDSFTLSGWRSQWLIARFPGQVVDAGPLAPVGHGIGMGIGAQLARPGKQVVVVIGDGGLGIGGGGGRDAPPAPPPPLPPPLGHKLRGARLPPH